MKPIVKWALAAALSALSSQVINAQELIVCSQYGGSSKTNCEAPKVLQEAAFVSDFTLFYNYTCKYNFNANAPVLMTTTDASSTNYHFVIGNGLRVDVPETQKVVFRYLNDLQPMFHKDCTLKITSIQQRPAASTLNLWRQEARRLQQLLEAKTQHYRDLLGMDDLIEKYSIVKLGAIQAEVQSAFNSLVRTALSQADADGPPGAQRTPRDFGLDYDRWDQVDVVALGMVTRMEDGPFYKIAADVNNPQHAWYFEAMDTLPVVGDVMAQVALVAGAKLVKEQARDSGHPMPDRSIVEVQLRELVAEARGFLNKIRDYREQLIDQIRPLEDQIGKTPASTEPSTKK